LESDMSQQSPSADSGHDIIEETLAAVRRYLGMDVAYLSRFEGDRQFYEAVEAGSRLAKAAEGHSIKIEDSYCRRVADGDLPSLIKDAKNDPRVSELATTRVGNIGSYIGIPVKFSDGRVYGSFCCIRHQPDPTLGDRDLELMHALAALVASHLEKLELAERNYRLQAEAAGSSALLAALVARDGYTAEHSDEVTALATEVARALGLSEEETTDITQVALLHDIGKIGVPDAVLRKPGPLDATEWELMKQHTIIGHRIASSIDGIAHLAPAIRAEHENWDGSGYPDGLAGEGIPLASRIVLACDAFHAMTSDRPYRRSLSTDEALEQIAKGAGSQFDPKVAAALLEVVRPEDEGLESDLESLATPAQSPPPPRRRRAKEAPESLVQWGAAYVRGLFRRS
jgi:response regulator RpfG family c-di-GMP phosphodiesterase